MAISTALTKLYYSTDGGTAYTPVADITSYPDFGSAPSLLDSTTLTAEKYKTNIFGLQEAPEMSFEANYDKTKLSTINGLIGSYKFKVEFGTSGANGIFTWDGHIMAYANGAGVDEVRKMTIVTTMESELTLA